ncbi:MAG: WhiB family transcriptional regulator [Cumulibacter sp.]
MTAMLNRPETDLPAEPDLFAPDFGARDDLPCRQEDADLWFAESPAKLETAKAHCQECPVLADCLMSAIDRREPWGVWGGQIFEQGTVIARKRGRGRPRKNAA